SVRALGCDTEVRAAEEHRSRLAGGVARDRERPQLVLEAWVAGFRVGDHTDFPSVRDDHGDVALRERRILLGLVSRLVRSGERRDQAVELGETLLRARRVERALPLAAGLGGDVAAEVPNERQ